MSYLKMQTAILGFMEINTMHVCCLLNYLIRSLVFIMSVWRHVKNRQNLPAVLLAALMFGHQSRKESHASQTSQAITTYYITLRSLSSSFWILDTLKCHKLQGLFFTLVSILCRAVRCVASKFVIFNYITSHYFSYVTQKLVLQCSKLIQKEKWVTNITSLPPFQHKHSLFVFSYPPPPFHAHHLPPSLK